MTNSDGSPVRRAALLDALPPGTVERVIDPGIGGCAGPVGRRRGGVGAMRNCGTAMVRQTVKIKMPWKREPEPEPEPEPEEEPEEEPEPEPYRDNRMGFVYIVEAGRL